MYQPRNVGATIDSPMASLPCPAETSLCRNRPSKRSISRPFCVRAYATTSSARSAPSSTGSRCWRRKGRVDQGIRARPDQTERRHGFGETAVLPHRIRSRSSAGAQIDLGDAEKIARGFLEDDKTKIDWNLPRALLAKNRVKLLLNMLVIAGQAIPRGGKVAVDPIGAGDNLGFKVTAAGTNAKIPHAVPPLLTGELGGETVDAHRIQPFYAGLLAKACGLKATVEMDGEAVVVSAQ